MTFSGYFSDKRLENRGTPELTRGFAKYRQIIRHAYQKALDAGIRIGLGTDGLHGELSYEIESLAELDHVTAVRALTAATADAAALCGVDDKVGALEAGKLADVLVLDGDPTEDIKNIEKVYRVFLGGKVVNDISAW